MKINQSMTKDEIQNIYRKRARFYNLTANLYYLIGIREYRYRKMAVRALSLKHGDTVVEVGCGTGLNFPIIQKYIGPTGKIIGVDLTDAMLNEARKSILKHKWANVLLVQSDAAKYKFPENVDGIISTFAISLVPEVGAVIANGSKALRRGGKWAICDMQMPDNWLSRFAPFIMPLVRPFAVSEEHIVKRPWETIQNTFRSTLTNVCKKNVYGGMLFVIEGEKA